MAPPPGVVSICTSATVVATAVVSVKTAVNTVKDAAIDHFLKQCDKCGARVKEEDMPGHQEKHTKEEKEKDLEHNLKVTQLQMEALKIETQQHKLALQNEAQRHRQELAEMEALKIQMQQHQLALQQEAQRNRQELAEMEALWESTCDVCKACVHVKDKKAHANIHRKAVSDHGRHEGDKSNMSQNQNGKNAPKRKGK